MSADTVLGVAIVALGTYLVGFMHGRYQVLRQRKSHAAPPPSAVDNAMLAAFDQVLPVVQFAVGNLPPETIKGWPHEALDAVAQRYLQLSGQSLGRITERELMVELRKFAAEAKGWETRRGPRLVGLHGQPHAGPEDFGPQTPEAKRAWDGAMNAGMGTSPADPPKSA